MKVTLLVILILILIAVLLYFALIGNTDKSGPEFVTFDEPVKFIGLEINTSDRDIYRDVGKVAAEFNSIKEKNPVPYKKEPWAFVAVSKDYDTDKRTFTYIVGDVVTRIDSIPEGLTSYEIPALTYAVFPVRPKSRLAWGITMGRMKKFIFREWLPKSGYEVSDIIGDFELHDERSLGKNPEIQLYVALSSGPGND